MRVAYVCADQGVPVFGRKGCSVHVQEIVRAFRQRAVRVELFAARVGGDPPGDLEDVRIHRLPSASKEDSTACEQFAVASNAALRADLEREGPFDMVYERYSLWSFAGMEYAQANGIPGLLEVNAPLIEEQARHRRLVDRRTAESVASRVLAAATASIAVSDEIAAYLQGYHEAQGRIHVIPNGVDLKRFAPERRPESPRDSTAFTVGFVGTLKPWHGLPTLIEAFAMHHRSSPSSCLLIVGDGPERKRLVKLVSAKDKRLIEHVQFTGSVPPAAVPKLLASMDAAIAPYPALENFYFSPLKVYEYMAAGLPIVASRVGQLATLLQHEVNALLCPPGDADALAAAISRLEDDRSLRERLGKAGRRAVEENHTWDGIIGQVFQLAGVEQPPRSLLATTSN